MAAFLMLPGVKVPHSRADIFHAWLKTYQNLLKTPISCLLSKNEEVCRDAAIIHRAEIG